MLLNKFYQADTQKEPGQILASVTFDSSHPIFQGHFPGNPVVPGVCMIQIVRELLEEALQYKLMIREGDNIKFLSVINPIQTPTVNASIQYLISDRMVGVQAALSFEQTIYFKMKGSFGKV